MSRIRLLWMQLNLVSEVVKKVVLYLTYSITLIPFNSGNEEAAIDGVQDLIKQNNINIVDHNGYTILHWAAIKGLDGVVNSLLQNGADVNRKDKTGKTPLQRATETSNF